MAIDHFLLLGERPEILVNLERWRISQTFRWIHLEWAKRLGR
jgi:hypothetical protein